MSFFKFYESLNLAEKLHVEEWNPSFDQVLTISVQLGGLNVEGEADNWDFGVGMYYATGNFNILVRMIGHHVLGLIPVKF
ncbi:unnamed protein product [Camellia sinensis]